MNDRVLAVQYENKGKDISISFQVRVPGTVEGEEWMEKKAVQRIALEVSQWIHAKDSEGNVRADHVKFAKDLNGKTVDFTHIAVGPDKHTAIDTVRINAYLNGVRALRGAPVFEGTSTADLCMVLQVPEEYRETITRIVDAQ